MYFFLNYVSDRGPDLSEMRGKVRETVSEFLFSGEESPTLETAWARVTGHKCGCGHKFVVISYRPDEPRENNKSEIFPRHDEGES